MRKKILNSLLVGLCIISLSATTVLAVEIKSATEAVNMAGKQRMFTQRMLKDYAMVGMGNTFGDPGEDLKQISAAFQEHMEALSTYTKVDDIKKSLTKLETLWRPLKQILADTPSKDKVEKLQIDLDTLLNFRT